MRIFTGVLIALGTQESDLGTYSYLFTSLSFIFLFILIFRRKLWQQK